MCPRLSYRPESENSGYNQERDTGWAHAKSVKGHISSFCFKLESIARGILWICLWNPRVPRNPLWETLVYVLTKAENI